MLLEFLLKKEKEKKHMKMRFLGFSSSSPESKRCCSPSEAAHSALGSRMEPGSPGTGGCGLTVFCRTAATWGTETVRLQDGKSLPAEGG